MTGRVVRPKIRSAVVAILLFGAIVNRGQAEDAARRPDRPAGVWQTTAILPAAEAHQAAAASDRCVYAITNRLIAAYDRASGARVAESRGEARHLNSGFLWGGKLYCAHSNYPHTPEQSEVKVLDVESMELSTYKDFGNSEGSLTWVVRHDGHWWCTFAYYGPQNSRTYLAQFNGRWQEQRRWRYPVEVVQRLGQASISGGLWWQGTILATGHDAREIYRLRIPEHGEVLEHVETMPSPFAGQGIACDPATGGLVGIDRRQRHIIFAELRGLTP